MKRIAIIQPSFLPWLGYFEQMARADVFVHFDDVQYTRKDWRNRNRLKSPFGIQTVTVPVGKHSYGISLINEIRIGMVPYWSEGLIQKISAWYAKSPYFDSIFPELCDILQSPFELLVDLNYALTDLLCRHLGIDTPQHKSSDIPNRTKDRNMTIINICKHHGADILYDGKSAQNFIDLDPFAAHGINVIFQDYMHTPYPQLWSGFESHLSTLDLLMNCGSESRDILLSSPVPEVLRVS
ncbi:MAG: WbqC family protein [Proteobacteria bacterium]|nr:WbqC family protein [Desulfobulbaceae bacterium]MBU4152034.1 WbqC family protein [Pseudomonadota bacterium]